MKKAHFDPKSKEWIISLIIMIIASAAVIAATAIIDMQANKKYNEPVQINFEIASTKELDISDMNTQSGNITRVQEAYDESGRLVAYIVENTVVGYNQESPILMSSIISANGELVCGINILSQRETEYLGTRISGEEFKKQFDGRYLPVVAENSTDRGSKIDMLANSTISSQAVIDGVNNAREFVEESFLAAQIN